MSPLDHKNKPRGGADDLPPDIDIEDVSLVNMRLDNGVLAAYQQCHFSPDYWRNYTVIGDAGRLENFGDWPMIMAANVLMTLPVIVIFFLCQRYFIQGMTMSGMKG